jgi:MFS family permease
VFPMLALGPLGGALADRLPRRPLLLVTQTALMVQAFALWGAWETGNGSYWMLFAISLVGGVVIAANTPAAQAFVTELVPRDYLQNAITLNSTQFNVARATGPMIAGLLIAHVGAGICFLVNALSFVLVVVALLAMSPAAQKRAADPGAGTGVIAAFITSLRYVWHHPGLRVAIGAHAVFALLGAPVVQLIPVLSVEALGVGSEAYGLLLGSFGIGAVAVALIIGTIDERIVRSQILAGGLLLAAGALLGLGLTPSVVVGVAFMVVFGAAYVTVTAMVHTSLQSLTDDRVRGRITSLWLMMFGLFFPLGTILQGVIADIVGVRAVLLGSAAAIAVALVWMTARRLLPRIDGPTAPAPP